MIKLVINGTAKTLADWDISSATLTFNSWAEDTLVFSANSPIDPAPGQWTIAEIFEDDVRIFRGTFSQVPVSLTPEGDSWSYTVVGPWWGLTRLQWQQSWREIRGGYVYAIHDRDEVCQIFGLHGDFYANGTAIYTNASHIMALHSVAFTLDNAFIYAADALASDLRFRFSAQRLTDYADDILERGTTLAGFTNNASWQETLGGPAPYPVPPYEEKHLATLGDILAACYKWMPDLLSFYDYSKEIPELHIVPSRTLEAVEVAPSEINNIAIAPVSDIAPTGLVLLKIKPTVTAMGGFSATYLRATPYYPNGVAISRTDPLTLTIPWELEDGEKDPGDLTAVATSLWDVVSRPALEGSLGFFSDDLITRWIGRKFSFNIAGVPSTPAIVQAESIDLTTGMRTLTFGATRALSSLDRIDQYKYLFEQSRGKSRWTPV